MFLLVDSMKQAITEFIVLIALTAAAQPTDPPTGVKVSPQNPQFAAPAIVNARFAADFPNTRASWSRQDDLYRAEFLPPGAAENTVLVYDASGKLLYKDQVLEADSVSRDILSYQQRLYPSEKMHARVRLSAGNRIYYLVARKDTVCFDRDGRRLTGNPLRTAPGPAR